MLIFSGACWLKSAVLVTTWRAELITNAVNKCWEISQFRHSTPLSGTRMTPHNQAEQIDREKLYGLLWNIQLFSCYYFSQDAWWEFAGGLHRNMYLSLSFDKGPKGTPFLDTGPPHLAIIVAIKCSNVQGTSQAIRLPKDDSDGPEGQSKTAFDPSTDNVSYRHKCLNALFVRKLVHEWEGVL